MFVSVSVGINPSASEGAVLAVLLTERIIADGGYYEGASIDCLINALNAL